MAYDATPTAARVVTAVRGSETLRAAWSVFWTTRAAVLVVAVFAALSFGPAGGGLAERNAETFDEPELTRSLAEPLLSPLARWDAAWYLRIAESGCGGGGRHAERRRAPAAAAGDALVELAAAEGSQRRLAPARPAGPRGVRRVPRPLRGRRLALPGRAGRLVARADRPAGRRVGRARGGHRRRAPADLGAARGRVLRAGRRRP